jgi:hypothetical protein
MAGGPGLEGGDDSIVQLPDVEGWHSARLASREPPIKRADGAEGVDPLASDYRARCRGPHEHATGRRQDLIGVPAHPLLHFRRASSRSSKLLSEATFPAPWTMEDAYACPNPSRYVNSFAIGS